MSKPARPAGAGKKGRRGSSPDETPQIEVSAEAVESSPLPPPVATAEQPPATPPLVGEVAQPFHDGASVHDPRPKPGAPAEPSPAPPPVAIAEQPLAQPKMVGEALEPSPVPPPAAIAEQPKPKMVGDAEETQRMLEDLDAGFDSIVRPGEGAPNAGSAPAASQASPAAPPAGDPKPQPPAELAAPEAVAFFDAAAVAGSPVTHAPAQPDPPSPTAVPAAAPYDAARHEADMAEVRELFAGIAVAYARPLRDFMIELAWGDPTKEWLDVALPAALALRRAAAAVELPEVDRALDGYATALELAGAEATFDAQVREMLSVAYARLVAALPAVFALEGERGRREPILVRSLLLQVPGVHKVTIDKLYAAGVHSLEVFYAARPRELSEATGLDQWLATAICERFQRYRQEVSALSPGKDRAKERAELASLVAALAVQHDAHERAAASWSPEAEARRAQARKDRAETVLRIDVALAQLGEVELQRALARMPFQQKIRELGRYLDDAEQKAARA